jgi:hypothetical protein
MQALAADARDLRAQPAGAACPGQRGAAGCQRTAGREGPPGRTGRARRADAHACQRRTLRAWLAEVRAGARARPVEAKLARSEAGPVGHRGGRARGLPGHEAAARHDGAAGRAAADAPSDSRTGWEAPRFDVLPRAAVALVVPWSARCWPRWSLHRPAGWPTPSPTPAASACCWPTPAAACGRAAPWLVLTGGPGSRDASALPGRLRWTFGLARENRARVELRLRHACCIGDQMRLRIEPGWAG